MPTDRPILFSAEMVRALLTGRKTVTRRVIKPLPVVTMREYGDYREVIWKDDNHLCNIGGGGTFEEMLRSAAGRCPYGAAGDRLWVREVHYCFGHWEPVDGPRKRTRTGRQRWRFVRDSDAVRYAPPIGHRLGMHHADPATSAWHKRLARFMPRSAARLALEVVSVRVERVQEITPGDVLAEGVPPRAWQRTDVPFDADLVPDFAALWDRINAERGYPWVDSPFVWVITFKVLQHS